MRVGDDAKLHESQVLDIPFREFMGDEIAMVRKICEQFGMEYTGEAERRMRAFLAANAAYQERFGMPSERI